MIKISVVIPVYRNEPFIDELVQSLGRELATLTDHYEILFIDDGSPDQSWLKILPAANRDQRIRGVRLTRNFGQHMAISAGLALSRGEWVVVMDGDLQDRPEEIPRLYRKALEGFDVVFARRRNRQDRWAKRMLSRLFYRLFDKLAGAGVRSDPDVANFGIYSRKVVNAFNTIREHSRLFPMVVRWLGFPPATIDVEHAPRSSGRSAYTFQKKLNLALDTIIVMSNQPLKLFIKAGFTLSLLSVLYGGFIILKYLFWGIPVQGWTSLIVSLYFLGGVQIASLGILGLYLGKTYDETKKRPLYVINDTTFGGTKHEPLQP